AFHFTGKLNPFDWTIFWADLCASLLLPPLFLHFCLEFPSRHKTIERWHSLLYLIYLPAAVSFIAPSAFINGILGFQPSPIVLRDLFARYGGRDRPLCHSDRCGWRTPARRFRAVERSCARDSHDRGGAAVRSDQGSIPGLAR